ncbi:PREDICTED: CMT1A duplicated region transcript 4 protein homolog [Thamnophis sirtalis]|uniref:CMT1A duplicated region transcript 4 protein homolog n=1 Tax=Thamnophis sirtalis TaxID=35019 RepID=A0A6I9XY18_9SAUR|nr:PREDICTED: CMT1A duplicated region transcript 4 protein homolog [Thamnophis sirtalis]
MALFLKDILQPSQKDTFNLLTQVQSHVDDPFKSTIKDRSLKSGNIGIPSHLIHVCRWPAYTTYTSPMVKNFIEQDKPRTATFLGASHSSSLAQHRRDTSEDLQRKTSPGSQESEAGQRSSEETQLSATVSFCWARKVSHYGGLGRPGSFTPTDNLVIFAKKRNPLRVLPMKLPDISQKGKNEGSGYTKIS